MEQKNLPDRSDLFLVFCLILLTIGFRIVDLKADPPGNFSWSGGYFADEGFWSHNARNEVLFGDPVQDEWDARIVSPVFAFVQSLSFKIFGVGLVQVRLIGIASSVLITVVSFLLFRRQLDAGACFFCSTLVCLNYPMLVLGRQGILDPFAAALALVALLLLLTESFFAVFLAGVLLVGACVTKYLMVYAFLPAAAVLWMKRNGKAYLIAFVGGLIVAALLWLWGNYLPHRDLLQGYGRYYSSQQSWQIPEILKNIMLQPFYLYFVKTPGILCFGNLLLWYFLIRPKTAGGVERICWIWLLAGIAFFALWKYRPERYYTSLMVPLAALAGMSLWRISEMGECFRSGHRRFVLWAGLTVPVAQMVFVLADRLGEWQILPPQVGVQQWDVIVFLALSFTIVFILIYRKGSRWAAIAFVAVFLVTDMRSYLTWMLRPQYAAEAISRDLQKRVGKGVLSGQWAPELCLENRVRVVPVWYGFVNSVDPFRKYGITHLLVWKYPLGGEKFDQWFPEEFKAFHPVAHYRIKDSDLLLYENYKGTEKKEP